MSRIRRSALFTPADEPDMMRKAASTDADALIFDLEDSVAPERVPDARRNLRTVVDDLPRRRELGARINGLGTGHWLADLEAVADADLDAVLVPKVESPATVSTVADALDELSDDPPTVRFAIESPAGLLAGRDLVARAADHAHVTGISFGLADYCRAIGAPDVDYRVRELLSFHVRTLAAAGDLDPFAATHLDPADEDGLRKAAQLARSLGYVGMAAIHPDQVTVINEVFTPDPERVERARKLVEAYEEAESNSLLVDGEFLDEATVERHRALVDRFEAIQSRDSE